ncbi:MAG: LamG domain-containing protein [Ktedonobacterales bacterium]
MTAKKLESFGGMVPAVDNRLLPDTAAAVAQNTWLYSGAVVGINSPKPLVTLSGPSIGKVFRLPNNIIDSEHLFDATFVEFADIDTDIIKSAIVNDTFERFYFASPSISPSYNTKARLTSTSAVKVLLHFDGPNNSTIVLDAAAKGLAHQWTCQEGAFINTAQFKFGGSSAFFGAGGLGANSYIDTPDHSDYTFGTSDFTIHCWVRSAALGAQRYIAGHADNAITPALSAWTLERNAANKIVAKVFQGSSTFTVTGTTSMDLNWHHVALVRFGNILRLFVDGSQEGGDVAFTGAVNDGAARLAVGRGGELATNTTWSGWIEEFVIAKTAIWSVGFPVPTTPSQGNGNWLLGVPTPGVAPTVVPAGGTSATQRTSSYVYTWVTAYGEEGPPSPPTLVTGKIDATWNVTMTLPDSSFLGVTRNLATVRIYRTVTSSSGVATYFLVDEQDVTDTTYADVKTETQVASSTALASTTWSAPPFDLKGIIAMPNGIMAGFRENEIWFCEPYRPHAWPAQYALAVDYKVVGLGVLNQTLVVLTQTYPVAISGVHPSVMTQSRMATLEPCLSRGSILSAPEGVYYCSANGLVLVTAGQASNITTQLITKDQWQKTVGVTTLSTLRAARVAGAYYAYGSVRPGVFEETAFDVGSGFAAEDFTGAFNGMLIDVNNARVAFNVLHGTVPMVNVMNDPWTGELMVIRNGVLYWIDIADADPVYETFTWRSKIFQADKKQNFGAARVFFETTDTAPALNPVQNMSLVQTLAADQWGLFRVYADGVLKMCRELRTSGEIFKLPSGFKADYWQFEFESRVKLLSFQVAGSARELAKV